MGSESSCGTCSAIRSRACSFSRRPFSDHANSCSQTYRKLVQTSLMQLRWALRFYYGLSRLEGSIPHIQLNLNGPQTEELFRQCSCLKDWVD
jgi:hypothetical protein